MKIVMEIICEVDGVESDEKLEQEIKDRIDAGCTITGQIGIGFDKEINFISIDGTIDIIE